MIPSNPDDYLTVTETVGEPVTTEQIERISARYGWAASFCQGKDVVEVACGTGQGLGILSRAAKSVCAGDVSPKMVELVRSHYQERVSVERFNASALPYEANSKDTILLFEAIYYLENVQPFLSECYRVLRPGGKLLITTANKDLFDFNPSPFSYRYYGVAELSQLLREHGFHSKFFGNIAVSDVSFRQKLLRPAKKVAREFGLIPKTMRGKRLLKRVVFGKLTPMPAELCSNEDKLPELSPLEPSQPDSRYKVIFCVATKRIES